MPRFNAYKLSNGPFKAMAALDATLAGTSIEEPLRHLIKLRASQINGCAYCIDMHWKDAKAGGETEQRLYGLDAWDESPYYTDRERAALLWCEAMTRLDHDHVGDEVYERVRQTLSEQEVSDLTCVVATINMWNRFAIASRSDAGTYHPREAHAASS
ncbi:MAG: carboxymuconolactone decarboxylase family protein [Phycisphaerales bacterium]